MWRKKREQDLERELRAHLELETEEQPDSYAAQRTLGNLGLIKENTRAMWGWTRLETLMQDLRYAARVLRRNPGFTSIAVLSLTLAIGANTALFSVLDAVLWKDLPVRDPGQLRVLTWERSPQSWAPLHSHSGYGYDTDGVHVSGSFSYSAYQSFRDRLPQFSDVVAFSANEFNVTAGGATESASGQFVSGNYFTGLGVSPIAGRAILPSDDAPGRPPVATLTYRYWERRFRLDPQIIGREISVNRVPVIVTGILPPEFQGLYPGRALDLFVPMSLLPSAGPPWFSLTAPDVWATQIFGRLRPGVTEAAAADAARSVLANEIEAFGGQPKPETHFPRVLLESGERGVGMFRLGRTTTFYSLSVLTGVVLLMACANLANLLLARSAARRREMAVRLSVGANRARLIRQLLTEALTLALLGGALGWIAARPLVTIVQRMITGPLPTSFEIRLDMRTLGFTIAVSVLTCLLAGILPALRSTRVDLSLGLKEGSAKRGGSRPWGGGTLVSVQVALSVLMLAGAGLFVRTLERLLTVDLGFRTERILTFQTDASAAGHESDRLAAFYELLREKIEAVPGVARAGMSHQSLLRNSYSNDNFYMPGDTPGSGSAYILQCSASFLSTMQIPLLRGRDLAPADGANAPAVAVVNETFVKRFLGGQSPVGRLLYFGDSQRPKTGAPAIQIVGIAGDTHYSSVRARVPPTVYVAYAQQPKPFGQVTFAVRSDLPPLAIAGAVRKAVAETDANLPVSGLTTMDELVSLSTDSERSFAELASAFASVEAVLAAIGLYGVMAFTVARRTPEIGIRLALGSSGRRVQWLVLRQSFAMVAAGLIVGVPLALLLTRYIRTMLYGIQPNDPVSFVTAAVLMAAVGAAAAWIPARRAAKVDPMVALRNE